MNVVITGGTGFIGYALIRELIKNGDIVTAIVRLGSDRINRIRNLKGVTIVETNLDNEIILPEDNYDVFYHLAWEGERDDPVEQYLNIKRTLNCIRIAAKYNCNRFICTGSQAEYGETDSIITEETLTNPTTSYGYAKVATYYLSKDLLRHYNISFVWVRVFSVYGDNDNSNTLYSKMMNALKNNEEFVLKTDGNHIWNYLHEDDAARALHLLYNDNVPEGIYNLASKNNNPLFWYINTMKQCTSSSSCIRFGTCESKVNLNVSTKKIRDVIGEFEKSDFKC